MERRMVVTQRECPALLVPVGTPISIPKDTFVTITQSLGGSFTIVHNGNMARVDGTDADALGMEKVFLHPFAGVLSAYGMGLADIRALREKQFEQSVSAVDNASEQLELLSREATAEVIE